MALGAPLVLSLAGHAALLALLAGAGYLAGPPAVRDAERVVPVRRPADAPPAPGRRPEFDAGEYGPAAAPAGPEEGSVALDSADPRYRPYLVGVKRRIWERWDAPALAAGLPAHGALVVEFTLARSGRLTASGIRESSGIPALDRAALAAVARAVPFRPLPAAIAGDSLRVRARFVYD